MHRHRPPNHFFMTLALPVCPWLFDGDLFGKGSLGKISRQLFDPWCRNANFISHSFWCIGIIKIGFGHQHKSWNSDTAFGQFDFALQMTARTSHIMGNRFAGFAIKNLRLAIGVTQKQPIIRLARITDHQPWRVCISAEIININIARQH